MTKSPLAKYPILTSNNYVLLFRIHEELEYSSFMIEIMQIIWYW